MKVFKLLKFCTRKILKYFLFFLAYPIVFFIEKIKKFKFIKLWEIDNSRIGSTTYLVEGYLAAKNFSDELKNCKIVPFSSFFVCNYQIKKMINRILPLSNFFFILIFLKKALLFWNKNDHVLDTSKFSLEVLLTDRNFNYNKPNLFFTEKEKMKGKDLIKKFGLKDGDKWICIHNRDSEYLKKTQHIRDWSYHDYRDFSINSLKSASEFFADRGYYVFRMGRYQKEKFNSENSKIIDYANSKLQSDFLDIYLLANSNFYFGSDSGIKSITLTFMRPCYGINWMPTLLYSDPGLFINSNNHLHPWLFIFKRFKCVKTGKKLPLKEILNNEFAFSANSKTFKKNDLCLINNSSEEIKSLAIEVTKEINGERIESTEDIKIQNEFWKLYFKYAGIEKIKNIVPRISPTFLRQNLDLLN